MRQRRSTIEDLRTAIDCLPLRTREAMLEGIRTNDIIVGAYSDRDGGVCPMLAAHRNGGRTSFISFARAWDAFSGARKARLATERELSILEAHLEASIHAEVVRTELTEGIESHRRLLRDRKTREAAQTGFGWLHDVVTTPEAVEPQREPERPRDLVRQ